jgi:hypothetical protein
VELAQELRIVVSAATHEAQAALCERLEVPRRVEASTEPLEPPFTWLLDHV